MPNNKVIESKKYLQLLRKSFPTILDASTEIINLEAILNLPKGTELFLSDLHGEDEAFVHILKSGSGIIRKKIDDVLGSTVTHSEKTKLAILIYYPKEVISKEIEQMTTKEDLNDWYTVTLNRLVLVCREISSKYTRSKVRKALPKDFQYMIEELLHNDTNTVNKNHYYDKIIKTIIDINVSGDFIIAISEVIQRLAIDHLHILGDIYDRGMGPDLIIDKLMQQNSVDIQWGNHDVIWMGAASGSLLCIMNTIRISARYGNLDIIENGYGISMLPFAQYAMHHFKEVEPIFYPKSGDLSEEEKLLSAQIHKAATLLMLKLEDQWIERNPQFEMFDRQLLRQINYETKEINLNGVVYPLNANGFETIDPDHPTELSEEETILLERLKKSYINNTKLQKHTAFLFSKGSIYKVYNGNLLFHGCIPFDDQGEYAKVNFEHNSYAGKELLDYFEAEIREGYVSRFADDNESRVDIFWYLWTGRYSSLFGKDQMKTFERYFIEDKSTHIEKKNLYYTLKNEEKTCVKILHDFGLDTKKAKIINGHVPVKVGTGEDPVKANGKLIVIDGGLGKAYQPVTGIAGYTLIYNSHGMLLAAHQPFSSAKEAYEKNVDMVSALTVVEAASQRIMVGDTDIGDKLKNEIHELSLLLEAFHSGTLKYSGR